MATINGTGLGEALEGTSGADVINGLGGNDTLNGHGGDDELDGGEGDDLLDGGDGNDTASYASAASMVEVDLRNAGPQNTLGAGTDTLLGIENITGSTHGDRLFGDEGDNLLIGGDGDDRLSAITGGNDLLRGGAGGDTYVIGQANVTIEETDAFNGSHVDSVWLTGTVSSYTLGANLEALRSFASVGGTLVGNDQDNLIEGSAHNDVIVGGLGDDVLDGDTGIDTLDYSGDALSGVTLDLSEGFNATATGGAGTDYVRNFENVSGSQFTDTLTGNASANELMGNGGDDILSGLGGNDVLRGGAGKDQLDGGADNDFLYGDADDDVLHGGAGDDNLDGGAGDDKLLAHSGINTLAGGEGNDLLVGGGNSDTLLGGDGDDTLDPGKRTVESAVDHLDGGAGTNTLSFATQNAPVRVSLNNGIAIVANAYLHSTFVNFSNLTGTDLALPAGNPGDVLTGDANSNRIRGLAGEDVLAGGSGGADILEGGEDGDAYVVDTEEDLDNMIVEEAGARGLDYVRTSLASYTLTAANVEGILGTNASGQTLTGNASDNIIAGFTGNDSLSGLGGKDTIYGDLGDDWIDGGEGDDTLYGDNVNTDLVGHGDDHLTGEGGDDALHGEGGDDILDGGAGGDAMFGGDGDDVYVVDSFDDLVTEAANAGTDEVRTDIGSRTDFTQTYMLPAFVENLVGTAAVAQGVIGNSLDNMIAMGDGGDLIVLHDGGVDTVTSGGGNDFIYYGDKLTAADSNDGGAGVDTVGLLGSYTLTLGATSLIDIEKLAMYSAGSAPGAVANNYSITTHDANVAAGGNLMVIAQSLLAHESLVFDGSAETNGSFNIRGGRGEDRITAGAGSDQIFGGLGADQLRGGAGNDFFEYYATAESTAASRDQILDFNAGDRINLIALDADGDASNGNGVFSYIGSSAFTNVAGQLRISGVGNSWLVEADTNGDGAADLVIDVITVGGHELGSNDFFL